MINYLPGLRGFIPAQLKCSAWFSAGGPPPASWAPLPRVSSASRTRGNLAWLPSPGGAGSRERRGQSLAALGVGWLQRKGFGGQRGDSEPHVGRVPRTPALHIGV